MSDRIQITALLFGQAREFAGAESLDLELEALATVASAFNALKTQHPKLAAMERSLLFAINEEYASPLQPLADHDRLAVLPPVSGGAPPEGDLVEITREPIDIAGLR
ncbi:MAG: MoaD/ThiS family protein, partial [Blastocatellia bacterium]